MADIKPKNKLPDSSVSSVAISEGYGSLKGRLCEGVSMVIEVIQFFQKSSLDTWEDMEKDAKGLHPYTVEQTQSLCDWYATSI